MAEMPPTLWRWDGSLLRPHSPYDHDVIAERYAPGSDLRARFSKPRSLPHHRLYFAVLQEVVQATGQWASVEDLHEAIKIEMRMLKGITLMNGEVRFLTSSIAFDTLDQGQFKVFFDRAMEAIGQATGIDVDALIAAAKARAGLAVEGQAA